VTKVKITDVEYRCECCYVVSIITCGGEPFETFGGFCWKCGHSTIFTRVKHIQDTGTNHPTPTPRLM